MKPEEVTEIADVMLSQLTEEAMERAEEPLAPELKPWLYESEMLGTCLKHPLVFAVPFWPQMAWRCNDQLAGKKKAVDKAVLDGDWDSYVFLHERPFRIGAMGHMASVIEDSQEFWQLLGSVYTDTENFWQHKGEWGRLLRSKRKDREFFMDEEEREFLAALPGDLTVYRGFNGKGTARSWAWTLDRDRGIWFANRLVHDGKPPTLVTGTASKSAVVGYLNGRSEEEIVVPAGKVIISGTEEIYRGEQ